MNIAAMLAEEVGLGRVPPLLDDENWFAEQKLDGHRVLTYVRSSFVGHLNRKGDVYSKPVPSDVTKELRHLVDTWVFDGELVGDTYWVFDLIEAAGTDLTMLPYERRREALERFFLGKYYSSIRVVPCATTSSEKRELATGLLQAGAEGLIFKHRQGLYTPGRRSEKMLKAKFVKTLDAVVLETWREGKASMSLGLFDEQGSLVDVGAVNMQGKPLDDIEPGDVVEVRYLYATEGLRLYQPAFLRVRDDKEAHSCLTDQMQVTTKRVLTS